MLNSFDQGLTMNLQFRFNPIRSVTSDRRKKALTEQIIDKALPDRNRPHRGIKEKHLNEKQSE